MKSFIFLFLFYWMALVFVFSDQDTASVPVQFQIEPYFEIIVKSFSIGIDADGMPDSREQIKNAALYFGQINTDDSYTSMFYKKKKHQNHDYASSHYTYAEVEIINNMKPFQLIIEYYQDDPSQKSLMDLKQQTQSKEDEPVNALQIRTRSVPDTQFANFIVELGSWRSFDSKFRLSLYNSENEIISDRFGVEFALKNLPSVIPGGTYGGKIVWNILSKY